MTGPSQKPARAERRRPLPRWREAARYFLAAGLAAAAAFGAAAAAAGAPLAGAAALAAGAAVDVAGASLSALASSGSVLGGTMVTMVGLPLAWVGRQPSGSFKSSICTAPWKSMPVRSTSI